MEQPTIAVKLISREEAQQLVRGSRIDPILYQSLVNNLKILLEQSEQAISISLPPETRYTTMKARLKRMALRLYLTVTIRKTEDGLVCWKETPEEATQRLSRSQKTQAETPERNDAHRSHTTDTA